MIRPARFRALCCALGDVEERPHFDRTAFRTPRRTFATLGPSGEDVNVLIPLELQDLLVTSHPSAFERIDNAWGAQGWTRMLLRNVDETTCREVLREAYVLATPVPKAKPAGARAKAKPTAAKGSKGTAKAKPVAKGLKRTAKAKSAAKASKGTAKAKRGR